MKTLRNIDITLVSLLLTFKRFNTFSWYFILEFRKVLPAGFTSRDQSTDSQIYKTWKGRWKLCHINQTGQATLWKETCIEFIKYAECRLWSNIYSNFYSARIISYRKKNIVETISVAITDSFNVRYFDLYLINIFTKSTKAERCTNITFKLTLYCLSDTADDLNL